MTNSSDPRTRSAFAPMVLDGHGRIDTVDVVDVDVVEALEGGIARAPDIVMRCVPGWLATKLNFAPSLRALPTSISDTP
ncbi:MAG TPA: hypothetical protein VM939_06900 [Gemmatimonadaceae bacterium]|nr:hypothetical protein [Gemmatimonadaceae bacterium]